MKPFARWVGVCAAVLMTGSLDRGGYRLSAQDPPGQPEGQSIQVEQLYAGTPAYSVMRTHDNALALAPVAVNAFTPTVAPCPASAGPRGCTMRVTVSSQFWNIGAADVGRINVTISGPGTLGPAGLVNVAAVTDPVWAGTHTMQWVKKNIPAGSAPTVTAAASVSGGAGFAGYRTISIDVFNGLL